jgi:hypothetical protein
MQRDVTMKRPVKLNQKCILFKNRTGRKVKHVLSGVYYQWEGGGYQERM